VSDGVSQRVIAGDLSGHVVAEARLPSRTLERILAEVEQRLTA
jgi:hypothetical protein